MQLGLLWVGTLSDFLVPAHVSRTVHTLSSEGPIFWEGHVFTKIGLFAKKGKKAVPI